MVPNLLVGHRQEEAGVEGGWRHSDFVSSWPTAAVPWQERENEGRREEEGRRWGERRGQKEDWIHYHGAKAYSDGV